MTMIENSKAASQDVFNHRMSQEIFNRQHTSLRNEYPLIGSPGKAKAEKGKSWLQKERERERERKKKKKKTLPE